MSSDNSSGPRRSPGRIVGRLVGVFGVMLTLVAVAYSVSVTVVDQLTIGVLAYPVDSAAPFVVITGAILAIPIVVPTVFVTLKLSQ